MAPVLLALGLNIAAFFYLQAWMPIVNFVKWIRLSRQIKAMRIAGLMVLLCALGAPARAQTVTAVQRDGDYVASQVIVQSQGYSMGEDGLIYKIEPQEVTGYAWLDNALRFVWNNCGKLLVLFLLLAAASIFSSMSGRGEDYSVVMRREAEAMETKSLGYEDGDYWSYDS